MCENQTCGDVTHPETLPEISDYLMSLFELINFVIISTIIGVFGIIFNIINIVIFYKHGLKNTVNIGLTALAVTDLCGLVVTEWFLLCFNPLFVKSEAHMVPIEVQHLTGGYPHSCFNRITAWINMYMTAERCLCIALPLKVKSIITPKMTTFMIVFIYLVMILSLLPEYMSSYIDWKFYPQLNRTLLGLVFTSTRDQVKELSSLLYAVYLIVAFIAVIIFTSVLVVKLRQSTRWRHGNKNSGTFSKRNQKTINMVVSVSILFIVTYSPAVGICVGTFVAPEFSVLGKYNRHFFAAISFGCICIVVNSSFNIIAYHKMSSKYRNTFHELFRSCLRGQLHPTEESTGDVQIDNKRSNWY